MRGLVCSHTTPVRHDWADSTGTIPSLSKAIPLLTVDILYDYTLNRFLFKIYL